MTPLERPRHTGFSVVELMITVAIVAIIATVALPSFNDLIVQNRLSSQANELVAGASLARTAAIETNSGGGLCPNRMDRASRPSAQKVAADQALAITARLRAGPTLAVGFVGSATRATWRCQARSQACPGPAPWHRACFAWGPLQPRDLR